MDNLTIWLSVNVLINVGIFHHIKATVPWLISSRAKEIIIKMHISHFRFMICDSLFLQAAVVKNEYSFAQVCKMSQMLG